jgi:hypothetical protein
MTVKSNVRTQRHKPDPEPLSMFSKTARWIGKGVLWALGVVVAAGITALATINLFPSVAKHFLRQHSVMIGTQFAHELPLYDCGLYSISLIPEAPIKSLDIVFHFDQPIHDAFLTTGTHSDPSHPGISGDLSLGPPCNFLKKSADQNGALTFLISSDRREITVRGRDVSLFDAQMFSVTFFPDYEKDEPRTDITARATYETGGFEFPAMVRMYDAWTRKYTILTQ